MFPTAVHRTARKDTAAYASLPLSTMSKSKTHPQQRTDHPRQRTEQSLSRPRPPKKGRPRAEAPRRQPRKNRAADEDVLSEPLPKVNTFFEDFFEIGIAPRHHLVFR